MNGRVIFVWVHQALEIPSWLVKECTEEVRLWPGLDWGCRLSQS